MSDPESPRDPEPLDEKLLYDVTLDYATLDDATDGMPAPFEDEEQYGFFGGLWATLTETLGDPVGFFRRTRTDGNILDAYLYALIVSGLPGALSGVINGLVGSHFQLHGTQLAITLYATAAFPLTIFVMSCISAGVIQVVLGMLGAEVRPWRRTLRVVMVSSGPGAIQVFGIVAALIAALLMRGSDSPIGSMITGIVGGIIGLTVAIWSMSITVRGLQRVHATSAGHAWIAVLAMPVLMVFAMLIGAVVLYSLYGDMLRKMAG